MSGGFVREGMKIYEFSTIGAFHVDHNEDAKVVEELAAQYLLIAVMDGCSSGKESHFASTLIAKVLRKIAKELSYRAFAEKQERELKAYQEEVIRRLFEDLKVLKDRLYLGMEELLSTLVLGLLDLNGQSAEIIAIGDGLVYCDGKAYEFEQGDKPDYLGYHLNEDFEEWFRTQTQRLSLEQFSDLSISTDGIFTFKHFDGGEYPSLSASDIIDGLLVDDQWQDYEMMLKKKVLELEREYGLSPSDDLAIIRIKC